MLALMGIRDWPIDERPREKLLERGAAALSDAEILAILLGSGRKGRSALDVARDAQVQAAELSRRQLSESLRAGPLLASPKATRDYLTARLRDLEHEVFCCLYLDKRHRLIQFEELFRGTIDGAERSSARDRETRAAEERGRGHRGPQSSFMLRRSVTTRVGCHRVQACCGRSAALAR
jgi:DNA repair protein RadC